MAANNSAQEWQSNTMGVKERLEILRSRAYFHDVRFRVEVRRSDGTGIDVQHFNAHKVLLASASPVFAEQFYGAGRVRADDFVDVRVTDVAHKAFELMLRYIYSQDLKFDSPYETLKTYEAAKKYKVKHLRNVASEYFQSCRLSPEDVVQILDNDINAEIQGLHQKCLDVTGEKPLQVIRLAAERAKSNTINLLLQMERLSVSSEFAILKELVNGIKSRTTDPQNPDAKFHLLRKFLHNIRFLTMTPQEFSLSLSICGPAIHQDEGFAILRLLSHPESGDFPLPSWINKLTRSRISQSSNVMELNLLPPYVSYADSISSTEQESSSLISALDIKAHGGRFAFTGVRLAYRRFVPEVRQQPEESRVSLARCTLNIRNNSAGVAYERVTNLQMDGRSTFLQFPVPLPVAAGEEARVSVILDGLDPVEFGRYVMRRHLAGNEIEGFQVLIDNYRVNDNTFAISKLYYT